MLSAGADRGAGGPSCWMERAGRALQLRLRGGPGTQTGRQGEARAAERLRGGCVGGLSCPGWLMTAGR